jgi:iron complex outermembrane recepter protein
MTNTQDGCRAAAKSDRAGRGVARSSVPLVSVLALTVGIFAPPHAVLAAEGDNTGIETIVVTAQKKEEILQDVPIAVGVLTAEAIQKQGIQNIDDFATKIPNVQAILPFGPQEPQFTVRGVTETDFQPNQSSPIAMYVDGVFKSVGALQALQLYDTERVEVEKGPQGTLQGRNATGGAINIYTVPPDFNNDGYVTAGVGNFGRYETEGAVNHTLIDDQLAARFAWTFTNVDGYFHNDAPGAPYGGDLTGVFDYAARLSFLWKPDSDFNAVLRLYDARSDPVNYGEYSKDPCCGGVGIPNGALAYLGIPQSVYSTSGETRAGLGYLDNDETDVHRREIKSRGFALEMNYFINDQFKLTSITGYDMGQWFTNENDAATVQSVDEARYFSRVHAFQEEVRLASTFDGPYNFILGALYGQESLFLNEDTAWDQYQPAIVSANGTTYNICLLSAFYTCDLQNSFNQKRVDYATYLNNTYQIFDNLQATVGARYTADSVSVQNYQANDSWIGPGGQIQSVNVVPGTPGGVEPNLSQSDHKWIGKAGLDYHITKDNLIYGSWNLGFRGSAYNAAAQTPAAVNSVKPESLIDYEIGSKNQFFDHTLQVNLSAFYYIYRNQQFATLSQTTGLSEEVNLPKVNDEGLEAELLYRPIKDVTLSFNAGYLDAIYQGGFVGGVSVQGNRVEVSPHWSWSTSVDWRAMTADWGTLDVYLDGNGVTKEYYDANNTLEAQQNGYTLWDARTTLDMPEHNVSLSLWTQNLFDRKYYTVLFNTESLINYSFGERGTPRTFGGTVTYKF